MAAELFLEAGEFLGVGGIEQGHQADEQDGCRGHRDQRTEAGNLGRLHHRLGVGRDPVALSSSITALDHGIAERLRRKRIRQQAFVLLEELQQVAAGDARGDVSSTRARSSAGSSPST